MLLLASRKTNGYRHETDTKKYKSLILQGLQGKINKVRFLPSAVIVKCSVYKELLSKPYKYCKR